MNKEYITISNKSGAIKKNGTNDYVWWFRAAGSNGTYAFLYVTYSGDWGNNNANRSNGVTPAFRLG